MKLDYSPAEISVVLLAAGHGKRMRPLTDHLPKPLLNVGGHALIEHHLMRLRDQGFAQVVINTAYLGDKIRATLGSGDRYGVTIAYSDESSTGALETAGGLKQALPLINSDPFLVINADIWTSLDFRTVLKPLSGSGRLVMVKNPEHNPNGDFSLCESGMLKIPDTFNTNTLTFAGVALYRKHIFSSIDSGKQALAPLLQELIQLDRLEAMTFDGDWTDVGTPARLDQLNRRYSEPS